MEQIDVNKLVELYNKEIITLYQRLFVATLESVQLSSSLNSYSDMLRSSQEEVQQLKEQLKMYQQKDE